MNNFLNHKNTIIALYVICGLNFALFLGTVLVDVVTNRVIKQLSEKRPHITPITDRETITFGSRPNWETDWEKERSSP